MKSLLAFAFITILTVTTNAQNVTKLHRYFNSATSGHFFTAAWEELGAGKGTFKYEGVAGYVFKEPTDGSTPVYRYWNNATKTHFFTASWEELGNGKWDYKFEGIGFYAYKTQAPGTVPFYRYYHDSKKVHFFTANKDELGEGKYGYKKEGIGFYLYPSEEAAAAAKNGTAAAPAASRPVLTPEEKALHVLKVIRLTYEAWTSSNASYYEPQAPVKDASTGRITAQQLLNPAGNEKFARIQLNWENDNIQSGIFHIFPNDFNIKLQWANERIDKIRIESLSECDYTVKYNDKDEITGLTANQLFNNRLRFVKEIELNGEKISKITAYENDINDSKPWTRSIKTYNYTNSNETSVNALVYKTGRPNTDKNIASNQNGTYTKINDSTFIAVQPWGETAEVVYNSNDLIRTKKITRNTRAEHHTYEYVGTKLFKETRVEFNNGAFVLKTIQVHFDYPAAAGLNDYEKLQGTYKFNEAGEMIWEARDSKYREKVNGAWGEWKYFRM